MFKYKTEAELTAMTPEQRDTYSEQKRAHEASLVKGQINEALEAFKTANPIPSAVELPITKEEVAEIKETLQQLKESGSAAPEGSYADIAKQIKENKDALKAIAKGDKKEIVIKADTVRASVATSVNTLVIAGIGQIQRIRRSLYDIFTKVPVSKGNHNGTIAYTDWDEATTVANAAAVAEGVAFNESTAKFKGYTLALQKVGDTLPVSEEFFEDYEMAAGELRSFITTNVDTKVDYELVKGDNTGSHLKGLLESVAAYDATPSAGTVVNPNIYDLIVKIMSKITSTGGNKYNPDFAAMNRTTIDRLVLAKDANDNYLFPPNHPIYNLIVEDNNFDDNTMVVGDRRYGKIYQMGGVTLSQGTTDTQFAEDLMTLKARVRLAFLIRTVDATGFKKVADITADLAELKAI